MLTDNQISLVFLLNIRYYLSNNYQGASRNYILENLEGSCRYFWHDDAWYFIDSRDDNIPKDFFNNESKDDIS